MVLKLIKDTMIWLLEKYKYDYSQQHVLKILDMIKKNHSVFIKCSNPHLKVKIDLSLQQFLAEQN